MTSLLWNGRITAKIRKKLTDAMITNGALYAKASREGRKKAVKNVPAEQTK